MNKRQRNLFSFRLSPHFLFQTAVLHDVCRDHQFQVWLRWPRWGRATVWSLSVAHVRHRWYLRGPGRHGASVLCVWWSEPRLALRGPHEYNPVFTDQQHTPKCTYLSRRDTQRQQQYTRGPVFAGMPCAGIQWWLQVCCHGGTYDRCPVSPAYQYSDVTKASWRLSLKSPTAQLFFFFNMLLRLMIKKSVKARIDCLWWRGPSCDRCNSPHKEPVRLESFPCHEVIIFYWFLTTLTLLTIIC